jgi:hypothetical protein
VGRRLSSARTRAFASTLAILLGLVATGQAAARGHVALGIAVNPPLNTTLTQQYIRAAGASPAVEMWFRDFDAPLFYTTELAQVHSIGATPMVTWDPMADGSVVPFAAIIKGQYDHYFTAQADYVASEHVLVYIRLMHEMNVHSTETPWGPGSSAGAATQFIRAWRHIVTIFRQQGVTNARWVWAPNVDCNGRCPFAAYYPGNSWVDDVALDGYNFAGVHHVAWMSLGQIFQSSYDKLTRMTTKPVMFTETASSNAGGNKAQWIKQGLLDTIPKLFPRVIEVTWWQRVDETDWRINSSPAVEAAWRAVVADPYYGGEGDVATSASAADTPVNRGASESRRLSKNRPNSRAQSTCRGHSHGCKKNVHWAHPARKRRRQHVNHDSSGNVVADTKATRAWR